MALMNRTNNSNSIQLDNLISRVKSTTAHPDTAATGHFFAKLQGKEMQHEPIHVTCANESTMTSTKTKELIIPELPPAATKAHVFPAMKRNLLSVPKLCDAGCICIFCKDKVIVAKNMKPILKGTRDTATNLWCIPIKAKEEDAPSSKLQIIDTTSKFNNEPAIRVVPQTANSAYTQRSLAELYAYLRKPDIICNKGSKNRPNIEKKT